MAESQRKWVFGSFSKNNSLSRTIDLFEECEGCGQRQIPLGLKIIQKYSEAVSDAYIRAMESTQQGETKTKEILGQYHDNWISHRMWIHKVGHKLEQCASQMFPAEVDGYKKTLKEIKNATSRLGEKTSHKPKEEAFYNLAWFIAAMPYDEHAIQRNLPVGENVQQDKEGFPTPWEANTKSF